MSAAAFIAPASARADATPLDADTQQPRFVFIDALRGLAALAVAGFHFSRQAKPDWVGLHVPTLGWVLSRGDVGVNVFFVISGFVMAHSLRNAWITPRYFGNFVLRRSLRLDPPYWTTIGLAYLAITLFPAATENIGGQPAGWKFLWPHFLYLQDLMRTTRSHDHSIVGVFWTLCLEVQFYLMLIACLWVVQYLNRALVRKWPAHRHAREWALLAVFLPLLVFSLLCAFWWNYYGKTQLSAFYLFQRGWFFGSWYMFFSGALVYWVLNKKVRLRWLLLTWAAMVGLWFSAPLQAAPAPHAGQATTQPQKSSRVAPATEHRSERIRGHRGGATVPATDSTIESAVKQKELLQPPTIEPRNILQKGIEMTLIAGIVVFMVGSMGYLETLWRHTIFQYFGRISYSLYLVHLVVGVPVVYYLLRALPDTGLMRLAIFFAGLASSIAAADVLYRAVERTSTRLSRRLKSGSRPANG